MKINLPLCEMVLVIATLLTAVPATIQATEAENSQSENPAPKLCGETLIVDRRMFPLDEAARSALPPGGLIQRRLKQVEALNAARVHGELDWSKYKFVRDEDRLALDIFCGAELGLVRFLLGKWDSGVLEFTFYKALAIQVPERVDTAVKTFMFHSQQDGIPNPADLETFQRQWEHFLTVREDVSNRFFDWQVGNFFP